MIVITGASDGIGLELAKLYKDAGKTVVNISRRTCKFATHNFLYDLQNGDNVLAAAIDVLALKEELEAVVNSIGVYTQKPFGELVDAEIDRVLTVNAGAPMLFISELMKRIKKDETDVLNVVSLAGTQGSKHNPVYATSKWAERGFTLSLQESLKDTPCRVISFCPGGIKTDLFEKAAADVDTKNWMEPGAIALLIKQILDMPKNIEVSEIIIKRKAVAA